MNFGMTLRENVAIYMRIVVFAKIDKKILLCEHFLGISFSPCAQEAP